jgi:hypothetical protein
VRGSLHDFLSRQQKSHGKSEYRIEKLDARHFDWQDKERGWIIQAACGGKG